MIKFSEYITELFSGQNGFNWQFKRGSSSQREYTFHVNGRDLTAQIDYYSGDSYREYEIAIFNDSARGTNNVRLTRDNDLKTTLQVYNTVVDILRKELLTKLKSGDTVIFDASQNHMIKVYSRFADLIAKEANGKVVLRNDPAAPGKFKVRIN